MATFEKRGKRIRVQVCIDGDRQSKTFASKAQAMQWAVDRETDSQRGSNTTKTVRDALKRYREEVSPTRKGRRFEELRIAFWERELSFVGKRLTDITPNDIGGYRDLRLKSVKPGTVLRELVLLSAVFTRARKEWGWCKINPVSDAYKPSAPPSRTRLITDTERDAIVLASGWKGGAPTRLIHEVAIAFLLALETAMRAGEVLKAIPNAAAYTAKLTDTKNNESREVPLSQAAVDLFKLMPNGFSISSASLDALFRKMRNALGIQNVTFHDTRHTAITRLAEIVPVMELARMTGHRALKSLMLYYNKPAEETAKRLRQPHPAQPLPVVPASAVLCLH